MNLFWSVVIAVMYALHQDVWFWRTARPLVFGVLPIGLAYHAAYCIAAALLMWALTTFAWPAHLELDRSRTARVGAGPREN
jgi:hypothetical protein